MAKQKPTKVSFKSKKWDKEEAEADIFIQPTPPEVIQNAMSIRKKACGLTIHDYVHSFTI